MFVLNSIENIISNIRDTNVWTNSNDKKHFIHDLNICEVWFIDRVNIANGDNSINIFIIIYLIAYENAKLKKLIDITLFNNPSIVNIFKMEASYGLHEDFRK